MRRPEDFVSTPPSYSTQPCSSNASFCYSGVPDAITHCIVDTYTSNVTITISCTKSYAQGDSEGYACTLFRYNEKNNRKLFEEIARTKSCIFALENFHEAVEFRVAAFNRYGSLPINTHGHVILLNQPTGSIDHLLLLYNRLSFSAKRNFVLHSETYGDHRQCFRWCNGVSLSLLPVWHLPSRSNETCQSYSSLPERS